MSNSQPGGLQLPPQNADDTPLNVVEPPAATRVYRCQCGRPVFFRNSRCLHCGIALGYLAAVHRVVPLLEGDAATRYRVHPAVRNVPAHLREQDLLRCANYDGPAACNWMVVADANGDGSEWCESCRLNHTIPDLGNSVYAEHWASIEIAKRRLVSSLLAIGLPLRSKLYDDPARGVMFDFLHGERADPVMTGHDEGLITLNIDEADDVHREQLRRTMHEPYRTLLGHLRHEIGHYYWDLLVDGSEAHPSFRALFGDESLDYEDAMQRHYEQGAPADWADHYVSAYATMHPWEGWAETWAHYLHMIDTLDTALSFGLSATNIELELEPFGRDALYWPDAEDADQFLAFVNDWTKLTGVLNEMSRSMGQPDFYPFVLPRDVVGKLQFIHAVVQRAAQSG